MLYWLQSERSDYRGTSLTRYCLPLEPYRKSMPRPLRCSQGETLFLERGTERTVDALS